MKTKNPRPEDLDGSIKPPAGDGSFPKAITTAGMLWLVLGGLTLSWVLVLVTRWWPELQMPFGAGGIPKVFLLFLVIPALIGIALVNIGVRTIRGTAQDTLSYSVCSIILGVCLGTKRIRVFDEREWGSAEEGISVGISVTLCVAGILALVGRKAYIAWRRNQ